MKLSATIADLVCDEHNNCTQTVPIIQPTPDLSLNASLKRVTTETAHCKPTNNVWNCGHYSISTSSTDYTPLVCSWFSVASLSLGVFIGIVFVLICGLVVARWWK